MILRNADIDAWFKFSQAVIQPTTNPTTVDVRSPYKVPYTAYRQQTVRLINTAGYLQPVNLEPPITLLAIRVLKASNFVTLQWQTTGVVTINAVPLWPGQFAIIPGEFEPGSFIRIGLSDAATGSGDGTVELLMLFNQP